VAILRYDVLIAGAGPAGCAVALALRRQGIATLLLDRGLHYPFRIGESAAPDVAGYLAQLGLPHLLEKHAPYHGNLMLWGGDTPQLDHFLFRAQGQGWHLDRAAFDQALKQHAKALGITILDDCNIDFIAPSAAGWQVKLRGFGEVAARIVVDAGGRRSPLATRLGAQRSQFDQLQALACHATQSEGLSSYSLIESCAYGWWYAAGLPDGRALVTLMSDHDIVKAQHLHDPEYFLAAWRATRLLAERVAPPDCAPQVHAFAAHSGCVSHAAGKNWVCVGDALMGLDPLTSSGISGALSDALAAAPAIAATLEGSIDATYRYVVRASHSFERYLLEWRQHYALETRWTNLPFWQRRKAMNVNANDVDRILTQ
jgi:flavin-dependent dehydrogenase